MKILSGSGENKDLSGLGTISKAYSDSLEKAENEQSGEKNREQSAWGDDPVFKNNKVVEKIREKNRRLSSSIWTDDPLLKPKKSIWVEQQTDEQIQKQEDDSQKSVYSQEDEQQKVSGQEQAILPIIRQSHQKEKKENKKEFSVNIPQDKLKEYEAAEQGSRPLKREELPKGKPSQPKPRSEVEIISDKFKAEEYARQVKVNSAKAKRMVSITIPMESEAKLNAAQRQAKSEILEFGGGPAEFGDTAKASKKSTKKAGSKKKKKSAKKNIDKHIWIVCVSVIAAALICTIIALLTMSRSGGSMEVISKTSESSSSQQGELIKIYEDVLVAGEGEEIRAMKIIETDSSQGKAYAQAVNEWKAQFEGCNVYSMNVSLPAAFYASEEDFSWEYDAWEAEEIIGKNLEGIINVRIANAMQQHKDEYIYSRTDKFWQPLGAYYAAQVFAQKAGVEYPDISEMEKVEIQGFAGSYSKYDDQLEKNPDSFTYYKPSWEYEVIYYDENFENPQQGEMFFDLQGEQCYKSILNGGENIVQINTQAENSRNLVIFTDGTANAFAAFLTKGFSKIYLCNIDGFSVDAAEFCENVGCTDLLFAVSDGFIFNEGSAEKISLLMKDESSEELL